MISDNESTVSYGGGISVDGATLGITNTTLSRNTADAHGGGIYVGNSAAVALHSGTITANTTSASGSR